MKKPTPPRLHQIHIGLGPNDHEPVKIYEAKSSVYEQEQEILETNLLDLCPSSLWPKGSHTSMCPRPVLVTREHQQQLAELHDALTTAITDIVERWWSDGEARFPERMPLEKQEEDLLRWLDGRVPEYRHCRGAWRPDFVIGGDGCAENDALVENPQITEINARFSFNGLLHQAYGQDSLELMGVGKNGLISGTDTGEIIEGMLSLFQRDRPLHLLKGEEPGMDIHMFIDIVQRRFNLRPRLITPADLRLLPDPQKEGGYRLCCLLKQNEPVHSSLITDKGEAVEEIHQVGLELHQRELHAMQPEMLQQIGLRCFNDMRTILLVHDKRMLGLVKQELHNLTARQVLSWTQAQTLEKSITDTFIPGSLHLDKLLQLSTDNPEIRKEFLLKPVRGGKGAGIIFGDEYEPIEWISALGRLQSPKLIPGETCVIQRRIVPRLYDVVLKTSGIKTQCPLVGTYHAMQGKLLGFGVWRISSKRICAISTGGSWTCTVMRDELRD